MIGHKFTISVTMDVSPFAWCLARAVLNISENNHHYINTSDFPFSEMAKYVGNFEGSTYWFSDDLTAGPQAAVCTISRDLLKPAFMTFRTFFYKII